MDLGLRDARVIVTGGAANIGRGIVHGFAAEGARWEYLSIAGHGGHVSFYNPQSLATLAKRSGFSVAAVRTRGVRFCEKGDCSKPVYRLAKIAGESLNLVAAALDKGHDMAVYLRRD